MPSRESRKRARNAESGAATGGMLSARTTWTGLGLGLGLGLRLGLGLGLGLNAQRAHDLEEHEERRGRCEG